MPKRKNSPTRPRKANKSVGFWQQCWGSFTRWTVKTHFWKRVFLTVIALLIFSIGSMYAIAQWYIHDNSNKPLIMGATFVPDYARYFGLDPKTTMSSMIYDLGLKRIRLVSYWDNIESKQGEYNFDELDWQFKMAEDAGVKVSLSVGLRQPRWPECHEPVWAQRMPGDSWQEPLNNFIVAVVNRYKNSPALDSYQLENEYFMSTFGVCPDFSRSRLIAEYNLVKSIDPETTLVVSRSNNASATWPIGEPRADLVGISVYKRVWDKVVTRRYFEYPLPAWFYGFLAGATKITTGRDTFVHELQAEPWTPEGVGGILDASLSEQDKSMNSVILKDRINYAEATGMRTIDLWGVEWWYWRKVRFNDPSLWNVAKVAIQKIDTKNKQL